MIKQFVRDIGIYGFSGMVVRLISFLLIPLYVRVLTTEDYGIIDLITLFGTLSAVVLSLELYQSVARYFGPGDEPTRKEYASTGLMLYLLSFTFFSALMLVFSETVSEFIFGMKGKQEVFRLAIFSIMTTAIFNYLQNLLRYSLQPIRYSIVNIVYSLITLSLSVYFVLFLNRGLEGVYLGLFAGAIPAIALGIWYNRHYLSFSLNSRVLKRMLQFSLPLIASSLAIYSLTYVDRLLIKHFLSLSDLGVYAVAFRIAAIPVVLLSIVNASFLPLIYNKYRDQNIGTDLIKIYRYCFGIGVLLIVLISMLSGTIVSVIATPEYHEAARVLPLLLFSGFFLQFAGMFVGLSLAEKTSIIALIYLGGLLTNLALNYLLIPALGITGAGWSALASSVLIFVLQYHFSWKYFPLTK